MVMRCPTAPRSVAVLVGTTLLTAAVAACGSSGARTAVRPEWVDAPTAEYPHELYIADVGVGDSQEVAKRRAVDRVALVFQCDVSTITEIISTYFESEGAQGMTAEKQTQFEQELKISAEQKLKDVTTPRTWLDESTGEHYALAVLDRSHATGVYLEELMREDEIVRSYLENHARESDKLTKLAYLNHALNEAAERDMLAEQLTVITAGRSPYATSVPASELVRARVDLRQAIGMKVDIDDTKWPGFANEVKSVMEGFGFELVTGGADYELRGGVSTERLDRKDVSIRWLAELHLVEASTGTEILTVSLTDRETHLSSFAEAERLGVNRATREIGRALRQRLEGHLESLIGS
jgi:hypothetical protein